MQFPKIGNLAPKFSLQNHEDKTVSLSDFKDESSVVVYFYPKAMTPGCTTQACDFRDSLGDLAGAGYRVIGISRDAVAKLERFAREEHLTFPLLSDPDHAVHDLYGTFGEKQLYGKTVTGAIRSTFVLDEAGVIELALYNVKATGHVNMLRKKLGLAA